MAKNRQTRLRARGQHLLVSGEIAERIIGHASIRPTDVVFEIGTGTGILTQRMARLAKRVISHEVDRRMFEIARKRLFEFGNIDLELTDTFTSSNIPYFDLCISNLPYSRSRDFVELLSTKAMKFRAAIVMVQREFAEKLLAAPGSRNYRAITVICRCCFSVEKLEKVERGAFSPSPSVQSVIIRILPKVQGLNPCLSPSEIASIKSIFSFRGRMVRVALRNCKAVPGVEGVLGENLLRTRVEKLQPYEFLNIMKVLKSDA